MSDIFTITDIPEYDSLTWYVTWPGRGVVRRQRYKMLEFASQTGDYRVGLCAGKDCVSIDCMLLYETAWEPEMLDHLFGSAHELSAVAFTERKYAEKFVDIAEKYISWKLLTEVPKEHN